MIYLDTAAPLKFIFEETGSRELERYLPDGAGLVSSALLVVKGRRGTFRRAPERMPRLDDRLTAAAASHGLKTATPV